MASIVRELSVCTDCIFFIANGDLPENEKDAERVTDAVSEWCRKHDSAHMVASSNSDDEAEFSWRPCECCLSHLGGSRHSAILLR